MKYASVLLAISCLLSAVNAQWLETSVQLPNSAEPFATYDRRFYSPLCIVLGVGFVALALL